jgi:hypothetical protein
MPSVRIMPEGNIRLSEAETKLASDMPNMRIMEDAKQTQ